MCEYVFQHRQHDQEIEEKPSKQISNFNEFFKKHLKELISLWYLQKVKEDLDKGVPVEKSNWM